jgi:hypothetical protein
MQIDKLKRQLVSALIMFVFLLVLFLVSLKISADIQERERARVQQALDAACGQGIVSQSEGTYGYDPVFNWSSPKAACYEDIIDHKLTCECKIPATGK